MLQLIRSQLFDERYGTASLIRRLIIEQVVPRWGAYALNFALMAATAACTTSSAYLIGHVVNETILAKDFKALVFLAMITVFLFTVQGLAAYGKTVLLARIGNEMITENQQLIFSKLLQENLDFFNSRPTATVITHVGIAVGAISSVVNTVVALGSDLLSLIGLTAVMIFQDPVASVIALIGMPVALLSLRNITHRVRRLARDQVANSATIMKTILECLQGLRVVKAFALEDEMRLRVKRAAMISKKLANTMARLSNRSSPLMESLGGCAVAMVFLYGGYRVIIMGAPPGSFVSFVTAFLLAYAPAKRLARVHLDLAGRMVGVRMYYEMIDSPPTEPDEPDKPELSVPAGRIEFKNVEFSYRPDQPVLRGLSFVAQAGRLTALVGPSGGGKTTAFNLILRLYTTGKGKILIDNQDISAISRVSLRRKIAYVGQDVFLFNGSIRENIAFGRLDAQQDEIVAAAKAAQAHDFITKLSDGYESFVGEQGLQLSTGQRQRISIARALVRNAKIILLDEPTSSLDSESEHLVQQALDRLCRGRTTLVIAHRLHTTVHADQIHVIENGQVVESGRHAEILARGGRYASLYTILLKSDKPQRDQTMANLQPT
jgi:ATP-binding cassette subfamily B protein